MKNRYADGDEYFWRSIDTLSDDTKMDRKTVMKAKKELLSQWKPVVGYEGWYSISSYGDVRREKEGRRGNCKAGKILKAFKDTAGYKRVKLFKDGIGKQFSVHRLVGTSFLGSKPLILVTNHKDGFKENNFYENLEYITRKENTNHALRMGLLPVGEMRWSAKLKRSQVIDIRKNAKEFSRKDLAKFYKVHVTTIADIICKRQWKNI